MSRRSRRRHYQTADLAPLWATHAWLVRRLRALGWSFQWASVDGLVGLSPPTPGGAYHSIVVPGGTYPSSRLSRSEYATLAVEVEGYYNACGAPVPSLASRHG